MTSQCAAVRGNQNKTSSVLAPAPEEARTPTETDSKRAETATASSWHRLATRAGTVQAKLTVNAPGDRYEQEADRVAEWVLRMPDPAPVQRKCAACEEEEGTVQRQAAPGTASTPPAIQRLCPSCEEAALQRQQVDGAGETLQAKQSGSAAPSVAPRTESRIASLRGGGRPLPEPVRSYFEPRFGRDFEKVRVHTGGNAATAAREVRARAFTVGSDVAFAAGEYRPETTEGRRLLAHELVHTVQQARNSGLDSRLQREQEEGETAREVTSPLSFKGKVEMKFDGSHLKILDGGTEVLKLPATSGRPTHVKSAHAKDCGGSTKETYVNNPLYLGITDHGAIPEGDYKIDPAKIQAFAEAEQIDLLEAAALHKKSHKVGGIPIHPGDWGRGRVPIEGVNIKKGPKGCGETTTRSAFFLHGGVLRGSAGCIDVGTAMDDLVIALRGYKRDVPLTVDYPKGAKGTNLSYCEVVAGELFYENKVRNWAVLVGCLTSLATSGDTEQDSVYQKLAARLLKKGVSLPGSGGGGSGSSGSGSSGGSILDQIFGND